MWTISNFKENVKIICPFHKKSTTVIKQEKPDCHFAPNLGMGY